MSSSQLFKPLKVGRNTLSHRVVLPPLTRYRATKKTHVPFAPLVSNYYKQRSSRPGTLLITEATLVSAQSGGDDHVPGIWSESQIAAWKEVTEAVHANGSFIYLQMWAFGRSAKPEILKVEGFPFVAPSPIPLHPENGTPREMTEFEIQDYIEQFVRAAKNSIEAGFDGVEVDAANGYLIDQFIQDVTNQRTDRYGGSIENRNRFGLEIVEAVTRGVGEDRTGVRISPWNTYQNMRMREPIPQFTDFVKKLKSAHPDLAYLHVNEPEPAHSARREDEAPESNDFIRAIWAPMPLITTGGYTRTTAIERSEAHDNELIAFGKLFISNPDLPTRLAHNIPLSPYDHSKFYPSSGKNESDEGYGDYPFADQLLSARTQIKL